jgi:hypothetical protein
MTFSTPGYSGQLFVETTHTVGEPGSFKTAHPAWLQLVRPLPGELQGVDIFNKNEKLVAKRLYFKKAKNSGPNLRYSSTVEIPRMKQEAITYQWATSLQLLCYQYIEHIISEKAEPDPAIVIPQVKLGVLLFCGTRELIEIIAHAGKIRSGWPCDDE